MPRGAKFYVGGGPGGRKDFRTLKEARAFYEANPDYTALGRWVEWVHGSHKGEVIERRKP